MGFKQIISGANPLATDVQQVIDALTGKNDVGGLSLYAQITAPGAPTVAINAVAGNLNGAYTYKVTFCTGYVDSDATVRINAETAGGTTSASVSPVNQKVNLTAIPIGPAGTVARRIYRTAAGGADGTQKLVTTINDNVTSTYTDNLADASLGAAVPTTNGTGSSLALSATQLAVSGVQPDQAQAPASPGTGTLAQVLSWLANRVKAITGATDWWDAPATTLAAANTHAGRTDNPHAVTAAQAAAVANAGNTPSVLAGTLASRPAAGTAGRLYVSTDTYEIFRDTGAAWDQVAANDQTASEILTAVKTVDGAGSGLDADLVRGLAPTLTATGSYAGDGTLSRAISVGFQPKMVLVLGLSSGVIGAMLYGSNLAASPMVYDTNPGGAAFFPLYGEEDSAGVKGSLSSTGFTTGNTTAYILNVNAVNYRWFAWS